MIHFPPHAKGCSAGFNPFYRAVRLVGSFEGCGRVQGILTVFFFGSFKACCRVQVFCLRACRVFLSVSCFRVVGLRVFRALRKGRDSGFLVRLGPRLLGSRAAPLNQG